MLYSGKNEGTSTTYNLEYMKVYKFSYRDACNFFAGRNSIFSHQEADKREPDPALRACSFLLSLSLSVPLIIWLHSSSTCILQYPPKGGNTGWKIFAYFKMISRRKLLAGLVGGKKLKEVVLKPNIDNFHKLKRTTLYFETLKLLRFD